PVRSARLCHRQRGSHVTQPFRSAPRRARRRARLAGDPGRPPESTERGRRPPRPHRRTPPPKRGFLGDPRVAGAVVVVGLAFVVEGGGREGTGGGGPGYTIADEPVSATYPRGTLAMARTTDAHSEGSQFFIVVADDAATSLTNTDPRRGYAIFGEVTDGMATV